MRFTAAIAATVLAYAAGVSAHATVFSLWVNGEDQGDGRSKYIRSPLTNNPVKDLTLPALACNTEGSQSLTEFVTVAAGDTLSTEWYHNTRGDDIIDSSHHGPIITYIAEFTKGDGSGAIWTKIDESGFDGSAWAVDKLRTNKGLYDFKLPASLAAGQYLIRQEIIALHEANTLFTEDPLRGAQFYPSCIQVEVTGSGTAVPNQAFDFNKGYTYSDPGIHFDVYGTVTSYDIPGPEVWDGSSSGGSGSAPAPAPAPTSTKAPAVSTSTSAAGSPATSVASQQPPSATATSAPVATPTAPTTGCRARRRRRSQRKH